VSRDPTERASSLGLSCAPALALIACFFVSGAASLVLELVWTRALRLVFGSTTLAVSTVLVAYMLGLGAGGLVGGRLAARSARPVRAYGWIELAVGLYALAVPFLIAALPAFTNAPFASLSYWPAALWSFAIALVLLAAPTFGMGLTLPLITRALVSDARAGSGVAVLYGVNTLGAVAGVLLAASSRSACWRCCSRVASRSSRPSRTRARPSASSPRAGIPPCSPTPRSASRRWSTR
jgi:spermidine synthase